MMIREPAAILPLMGASGWGKRACESPGMPGELFTDIYTVSVRGKSTPAYLFKTLEANGGEREEVVEDEYQR